MPNNAPWQKYLDGKPPPRQDEFEVRSVINGSEFRYIVVRDWRRGAHFQEGGTPAVGVDEVAVLKRATGGASLAPTMAAGVLRVKSILGGAVVSARSLGE